MDLPVVQALKMVNSASFSWLDGAYQTALPSDVIGNTDKTIVLITEFLSEPTNFGNSKFKGWLIGVEAQIFYKSKIDFNTLNAEIDFARLFEKSGWHIEQSKNHTKDPDTKQLSKVFYFSKKLKIEEAN